MFSFISLTFDFVLQQEELEAALAEAQASLLWREQEWTGEQASFTTEVDFSFFLHFNY